MAKIEIIYECRNEIEQIIKSVKDYIELNDDGKEERVKAEINKIIQDAFDEGRKFQNKNSGVPVTK